jgi:hypothetical protein
MQPRLDVLNALRPLTGLQLAIARDAAGAKTFQFGDIRPHPTGRGTAGQYALHVSCAWRITSTLGIVTGSSDRHEGTGPDELRDEEDWMGGNLQVKKLSELFGGSDPATGAIVNVRSLLVVQAVKADSHGGIELILSSGYSLQVFPDGSHPEAWRLFIPGEKTSHFVFPEEIL